MKLLEGTRVLARGALQELLLQGQCRRDQMRTVIVNSEIDIMLSSRAGQVRELRSKCRMIFTDSSPAS